MLPKRVKAIPEDGTILIKESYNFEQMQTQNDHMY